MIKIATIDTYTQKSWEKDMPVKTEAKLGKKDKPGIKLGRRKILVLKQVCVVLAISLIVTFLGTYWLGFSYACKPTNQILPMKPNKSTGIPKSEGTNKEIPVETGQADNIIDLVTNLHKSNTNNSSELNGEDIDATSEPKNDTDYFLAFQIVFQKLYQDFSIMETDDDEGEEGISVETGKDDKTINRATSLHKTNLKNSSKSNGPHIEATSKSKNDTDFEQALLNVFQKLHQDFSIVETDDDEGEEGISVETGNDDKTINRATSLHKTNLKNSSESNRPHIEATSKSKNDTDFVQALLNVFQGLDLVFEKDEGVSTVTSETDDGEGEEETPCVSSVSFASITLGYYKTIIHGYEIIGPTGRWKTFTRGIFSSGSLPMNVPFTLIHKKESHGIISGDMGCQ